MPPRRLSRRSSSLSAGRDHGCAAASVLPTGLAAKHFDIIVADDDLSWSRNEVRIAGEARLDGIYVVRTSLDATAIASHEAIEA